MAHLIPRRPDRHRRDHHGCSADRSCRDGAPRGGADAPVHPAAARTPGPAAGEGDPADAGVESYRIEEALGPPTHRCTPTMRSRRPTGCPSRWRPVSTPADRGPRVHPPRTRPEVGDPLCSDAGGAEPCLGPPGCRRGQPWPAGTPSTKHPPPRVGPPTWHRRGRQGGSGTSSRPALAQRLDGRCRVHGGALHQLRSPPSVSSVGTSRRPPHTSIQIHPSCSMRPRRRRRGQPRPAGVERRRRRRQLGCRHRARRPEPAVGADPGRAAARPTGTRGRGSPRSSSPVDLAVGPGRPAQGRFIAFVNYYRKGTASQGYSSAEVVETRTVHLLIA